MVLMPRQKPTITFIIPFQHDKEFLIEQINAIFSFSEKYGGFCEILVPTDEQEEERLKSVWLAIEPNRTSHPYVRTRLIRYTSQLPLADLIEAGINRAIGQKTVITTGTPEKIEVGKINNLMGRDLVVTQYTFDVDVLKESLM
jgi:hypothetical protein